MSRSAPPGAQIAAATHPDRPDGGDLARYTQACAAYAELRTPWGRSEAWADLHRAPPGHHPPPAVPPGWEGRPPPTIRPLLLLPERIRHGRPLRLALRAAAAALLSCCRAGPDPRPARRPRHSSSA